MPVYTKLTIPGRCLNHGIRHLIRPCLLCGISGTPLRCKPTAELWRIWRANEMCPGMGSTCMQHTMATYVIPGYTWVLCFYQFGRARVRISMRGAGVLLSSKKPTRSFRISNIYMSGQLLHHCGKYYAELRYPQP